MADEFSKNEYVLDNIVESYSKHNQCPMWRIRWYHPATDTYHEMTVDSSYRNFTKCGWDEFVKQSNPYGIYEDFETTSRLTNWNRPVVSADAEPKRTCICSKEQAKELIETCRKDYADKQFLNPQLFEVM